MAHNSSQDDLPKAFCMLPWTQLATSVKGYVRLCCHTPPLRNPDGSRVLLGEAPTIEDVWNCEPMKRVRRQMMTGELPDLCRRCIDQEKIGVQSKRIKFNKLRPEWAGDFQDLLKATTEDGQLKVRPRSFDLRLGNLCNLKCVMCRPEFSTKWEKDFEEMQNRGLEIPTSALEHLSYPGKGSEGSYRWYEQPEILQYLEEHLTDIKQLYFAGGEPLLAPFHKSLIQLIVEKGLAQDVHLAYDTNGLLVDEEWLKLWENFASVDIRVSIDGVGEKYEYLRYPGKWVDFEAKARLLANWKYPGAIFRILVTQQTLNVLDQAELVDWYWSIFSQPPKVKYGVVFNSVEWPECQSVGLLPEVVRQVADSKIEQAYQRAQDSGASRGHLFSLHDLRDRLRFSFGVHQPRPDGLKDFMTYQDTVDRVRGTNWRQVFPELWALLAEKSLAQPEIR